MATAPKKTALSAAPVDASVVAAPPAAAPQIAASPAAALGALQAPLRAAAEKGLGETRSAFVKAKVAASETVEALETSYAAARAGLVAINAKALDSLTENVEANFGFVKSAFGVGGFADYFALQGEFVRARLDAVADQAKTLGELTHKAAVDSLEPIQAQFAKGFKIAG